MLTINADARRGMLAAVLCVTLVSSGCATMNSGAARPPAPADRAVLADYVQRLAPGTAVRVERAGGRALRGTLMKATAEVIVVQPRTRLPEAPIEIPLDHVLAVTPEAESRNLGTAIAAGAAAGAGGALAVFLILAAIFSN
jgi:hypothetical protein